MAVIGTFGSFTAARLAIYSSQSAMNLVGNNISNINTKGYTRERLDITSLYNTGEPRYANSYNLNIGYGAIANQVSQLRDPFLDIRYRNENSSLGAAEATINGLQQITHLLDEVGKGVDEKEDFGVIQAQLEDFVSRLNDLLNEVGQDTYDDLLRGSADTLCKLFNSVANGLEEVRTNEVGYLEQSVDAVNSCLKRIRDLNEQIRTHEIYGDNALELRDARNVAIDELSKYMKINVTYSKERIDACTEVEKLTITLPDTADPDTESKNEGKEIKLIDGIYGTQIGIRKDYIENPEYEAAHHKYVDAAGNPTDDPGTDAAPNALNKAYFPYKNLKDELTEAAFTQNQKNPNYKGKYVPDPEKASEEERNQGWTDDVTHAKRELVQNPVWEQDPKDPKYTSKFRIKNTAADGTVTYAYTNDEKADGAKANPHYQPQYVTPTGGLTDDGAKAKRTIVMNDAYDPKVGKYLDPTDPAGQRTTNEPTTPHEKNPDYVGKYTTADGGSTDDEAEADYVYDSKYLIELDPLIDKRGDYMLEKKNGEELKNITRLTDTDTSGALQAVREMLTEEGVFASKVDVEGSGALDVAGMDTVEAKEAQNYADLAKDPGATQKMGIPYYQKVLDNLAQLFAKTMNEANQIPLDKAEAAYQHGTIAISGAGVPQVEASGFFTTDEDGKPTLITKDGEELNANGTNALKPEDLKYKNDPPTQEEIDRVQGYLDLLRAQGQLTPEYEYYNGGVLFSNLSDGDDPTGITAANISVAHSWSIGEVRILRSVEPEYIDPVTGEKDTSTTANDNIGHMVTLMGQQMDFLAQGYSEDTATDAMAVKPFFKGSFQEMFTNISGTLAHDTEVTTALYTTYNLNTLNLDNDRTSVSGVDLNEEAVNIMQYQKSYAAACQLLTTLDSMLDKLINGTL